MRWVWICCLAYVVLLSSACTVGPAWDFRGTERCEPVFVLQPTRDGSFLAVPVLRCPARELGWSLAPY